MYNAEPKIASQIWIKDNEYSWCWVCRNATAQNVKQKKLTSTDNENAIKLENWVTVKAKADTIKITVLQKGNHKLSTGRPSIKGQILPSWILGSIEEWKKPQKKLKKNIISDTINKKNPTAKFERYNHFVPDNQTNSRR